MAFGAIITCSGQSNNLISSNADSKTVKSCQNRIENKAIGICNIQTDSITYDQLTRCGELTSAIDKQLIESYNLWYFTNDSTAVNRYIPNNKIPDDLVKIIVKSKIKKILFAEVLGIQGTVFATLGFRYFYLK